MGDRLATIDMGRKVGGDCCAPFRGAGSPSNTVWPAVPRSTSVQSGILIYAAVWPQYTNVTERQTEQIDRTDRQTDRQTTFQ